jgi:hypothetical protein
MYFPVPLKATEAQETFVFTPKFAYNIVCMYIIQMEMKQLFVPSSHILLPQDAVEHMKFILQIILYPFDMNKQYNNHFPEILACGGAHQKLSSNRLICI